MNNTSIPKAAMISVGSPYGAAINHLNEFINADTSTPRDILPIVLMFAAFWYCSFYVLKKVIHRLVHGKQWLIDAMERDYERGGKKMLADLQINMTKKEANEWRMNDWPRLQCIYLQHLVGSLFCLPSLLGIGDSQVASSLACLGVLSEMGWELQDLAEMFIVRIFCENGKQIWPDAILIIFLVHHSLTMILGVPMIIFYRTNRVLHWLCFDLQFAAFVGLSLGEYTKVLDIKDPSQLFRFKIANFIALVTMAWSRVFHWGYLCAQLFTTWYKDGAWAFLFLGSILSIIFSAFSFLACVKPFYTKFVKFLYVSCENEAIEKDLSASVETRRCSAVRLEQAVADLLEENETRKLTDFMESTFITRKISRRHTLNNIKGTKTFSQAVGRKRHSMLMIKEFAEKLKQV